MRFFYSCAPLPGDRALAMDINEAAERLHRKLGACDVKALDISDYNKRYMGHYVERLESSLQLYTDILLRSLSGSGIAPGESTLVDYGGGCGMLSLLARELGVGGVVYSDIYDVSCRDARVIGESLGLSADHYVEGDVDDLLGFLKENKLVCHAVASHDVIEHIYDMEEFIQKIALISDSRLTFVMTSSANILNPNAVRQISRKQIAHEHQDRQGEWGSKERDSLKSYLKIRREAIVARLKERECEVDESTIEELARNTRGMMVADSLRCADEYLKTKRMPAPPGHPTNTCDPMTGNWSEHLMDQPYLVGLLTKAGFRARVCKGYYGSSGSTLKSIVKKSLNIAIRLSGEQGMRLSPYYILYARE